MHTQENHRNALPTGYQLQEYQIQSLLGHGGFGITYLAHDTKLDAQVAIKEYLPNEIAVREGDYTVQPKSPQDANDFAWGLDRFLQEARTLAQFKHPNIVRVLRFFEAHNTAYIVMEYEQGQSLASALKDGETATEAELLALLPPLLDGLETVHKAGYLHRDIKPGNICLRDKDQSPVLIDFGAARYEVGSRSRSVTQIVTPGYSPFEQYQGKGSHQGPWTDIYALGAVLYRTIGGTMPVEATERIDAIVDNKPDPQTPAVQVGRGRYSKPLLQAIDWALQAQKADRPQNVTEWAKAIFPPEQPRAKPLKRIAIGLLALLVIGAIGVYFAYPHLHNGRPNKIAETEATAEQVQREREARATAQAEAARQARLAEEARQARLTAEAEAARQARLAEEARRQAEAERQARLAEEARRQAELERQRLEQQRREREAQQALTAGIAAYNRSDYATALEKLKPLAEQGNAEAQNQLGEMYYYGKGVAQDYAKAVHWYRKAAEQGNALGQTNLGFMYRNGKGVAQNDSQAVHWFRKAAEQNNAWGQNNLGVMYLNGKGVAQNDSQAVHWFRKAAEQGNAWGQNNLGVMYRNGKGVAQDYAQAVYWFRKAAEQGNASGQYNLGDMYEYGKGVAQDYAKAIHWYRKAAEQGHALGQTNLGVMYENGKGVAQDYAKAVHWYRKAAEQGHANGQYNLGWMYRKGKGVAQNDSQAVYWYRKAAEQGHANGQYNLGWMYQNGKGVPTDKREANKWYRKAAAQGHTGAKNKLMTTSQ